MALSMMTGEKLAARFVAENPHSTLSRNAIKVMLRGGCVPSVTAGNRKFYSYERFCQFLEDGNDQPVNDGYGTIRRIV